MMKPSLFHNKYKMWLLIGMLGLGLILAGCQGIMNSEPRYDPLVYSQFFADGRSARPISTDTVSQEDPVNPNDPFFTGKDANGSMVTTMPISITLDVLQRGQQRYDIYCSPCHGYDGYGDGMIVQRGFSPPPSYHTDALRSSPDGLFFNVITGGFGRMYSYAYRIPPADRWAIVAYIRALQLSQDASKNQIPPEDQSKLPGGTP